MLIRKNTKAFKTILEIVTACRDRPDREALIRLYITKAGDTVNERIHVEGIQGEAGLFYEMTYQAVLGNLNSANHQLHESDDVPGVYFFHSSSNKVWDETPFEFDEAIKKEFGSLPALPVLRKKEKAEKFSFPAASMKSGLKSAAKEKGHTKKDKAEPKKSARVVALWPKQPDYQLKKEIHFTGLERIVSRQAQLTKRDVLDYYNGISEYFLPHLKDRPLSIRLQRDGQQSSLTDGLASLRQNSADEIPDWVQSASVGKGKTQEQLLLCNDKEHLLLYLQIGSLEFYAGLSHVNALDSPDYIVLTIDSPDYELARAIDVALAAREILTGLQLPSFVKTDGTSALHVYIPVKSGNDFEVSKAVAEYLCRLVRLKVPDLVTLKGSEGSARGKVTMDYSINEQRRGIIVPYSLVGSSANVATPLSWEEVNDGLKVEAFNYKTIFKRLKDVGDPFDTLLKKRVDASALLERIEENYSFLF